jgi:hypothetical protein
MPTAMQEDALARAGFAPRRMAALMQDAVARCRLDLGGLVVLTEAAIGAYASTAAIAALAGARHVHAFARDTRYGTAVELGAQTLSLARAAGVADRVEILTDPPVSVAHEVDLMTNSGSLRPLTGELIARLPARAVVALMYEAWELRPSDIDLDACRRHGVPVAAVNERHPSVGVFAYLGPLALRLLHDAGIPVHGCRIALLCDNPFAPFIQATLEQLAEVVHSAADASDLPHERFDAVLVALRPGDGPVLDAAAAERLVARAGPAPIVQFWGDVDRMALRALGVPVWPPREPQSGHMAILLSALGPDAVVRLQAGGLRAAELVRRHGPPTDPDGEAELLPLAGRTLEATA